MGERVISLYFSLVIVNRIVSFDYYKNAFQETLNSTQKHETKSGIYFKKWLINAIILIFNTA